MHTWEKTRTPVAFTLYDRMFVVIRGSVVEQGEASLWVFEVVTVAS